MLPDSIRNIYDSVGIIGILLIFTFGGRIIWPLVNPVVNFVEFSVVKDFDPDFMADISKINEQARRQAACGPQASCTSGNYVGALANWVKLRTRTSASSSSLIGTRSPPTTLILRTLVRTLLKSRWTGSPPASIPSDAPCSSSRTCPNMRNCTCYFQ